MDSSTGSETKDSIVYMNSTSPPEQPDLLRNLYSRFESAHLKRLSNNGLRILLYHNTYPHIHKHIHTYTYKNIRAHTYTRTMYVVHAYTRKHTQTH